MGLIKGLHHVALKAGSDAQYAEIIKFYTEVLGFEVIRSWGEGEDRGIMMGAGDLIIEAFASGLTVADTGAVNHYAVATDDVDGCVEAVRAAGYEIKMEPKDIVIGSAIPFPARIAFCYGPVREEIEFFCEK